ncbi:MAG: GMP/IMP nucleotidase, partial [Gammaproteobacteria bacterium]|nr:GMP/IMP nucleotidase [Gammaproteobacteria bacterium]
EYLTMLEWDNIDTVLLDMDGTLLDLAFDNLFWVKLVPEHYAKTHNMSHSDVIESLAPHFEQKRHSLDWYNLDYWSDYLKIDLAALKVAHQQHIDFLPMAEFFLQRLQKQEQQVLIVTNADPKAYMIKHAKTGVGDWVDEVITSHDLGYPKEEQDFWHVLQEHVGFDKSTSLFVDDSPRVLQAAHDYGIEHVAAICKPDTSREGSAFTDESSLQELPERVHRIDGVMDLLGI